MAFKFTLLTLVMLGLLGISSSVNSNKKNGTEVFLQVSSVDELNVALKNCRE